ncbi:MAG: LytR C-terminal domain-containing protein [Candidatus Cloacimonetes bacterium]|nr:LytR C-terminal domain-containing protein [Candidatus Cloacimonadota bacterium]
MKKILIIISILIILGCGLYFYFVIYPKMKDKTDHTEEQYPAIKIGLVNGCGYQGVAGNIAEAMTDKNIDVVQISNARKFIYKESVIVVKIDDKNELERLKKMTGITHVIYALNDTYPVPFLIIAGKDYQTYFH